MECEASRTANWRSITSEFFGFGGLPTVKASNTVRILGISTASLSQHFSRWLSLKWHHRNNLMVIVLVPKLLSLQVKQHYISWVFLSPSTTSVI